jgi:hypothetical protein
MRGTRAVMLWQCCLALTLRAPIGACVADQRTVMETGQGRRTADLGAAPLPQCSA